MMPAYREKNNLIHQLHPVTSLVFVGAVFTLALVFSHPLYLLGLFVAEGAVIGAAGIFKEWKSYLKFSIFMIVLLILINALFSRTGATLLFSGPEVPLLGKFKITLEALAYGAGMGLKLLVIISIFCFYTYGVHPDKVLKLFGRWGSKSVLAITLTTRLFPLMTQDFKRIKEVQRCRGVHLETGKWYEKVQNFIPIFSVLLVSGLERALKLAESMHVRGYGSGSRSCYRNDFWRPRDFLILLTLMLSLVLGLWAAFRGWASYDYYPRLTGFQINEIEIPGIISIGILVPALLSWGWMKWPLLKSKI
ncbi:MAG: energy-coupling factor transporter transmembrane component T family protein [Bacillota bacterium]|jgi:energy-coupling factor transport system permease protein|nr:energy-coupling factor transporter transmembrane protein EcfT [Clostridia bacterium]